MVGLLTLASLICLCLVLLGVVDRCALAPDSAMKNGLVNSCIAASQALHWVLSVGVILMTLYLPVAFGAALVNIASMRPAVEPIFVVFDLVRRHLFACRH